MDTNIKNTGDQIKEVIAELCIPKANDETKKETIDCLIKSSLRKKDVTSIRLTPFISMKLRELSIAHNTNIATLIRTLLLYAINKITDSSGYEK